MTYIVAALLLLWLALFLRRQGRLALAPQEDPLVYASCEGVTATAVSPKHLRRTVRSALALGGGLPEGEEALCGRSLRLGWDLAEEPLEGLRQAWEVRSSTGAIPRRLCPTCLRRVAQEEAWPL